MAYTSILAVHRLERSVEYVTNKDKTVRPRPDSASSLQEAVDYTRNREKTECDVFESAIGCTLETAFEDMLANKKRWNQIDGVQGYHLVQSFAEGELTPELAHRIGLELAEKLLCGKYPAVIATHLNTRCLHNHIVWDSVAMDTGRKYRSNARSYYTEVRALSDRFVPFPVSWTVKMKKKQKETQDILSYHSQAAGCSDKARAKASGGRQPIEECGRTGL